MIQRDPCRSNWLRQQEAASNTSSDIPGVLGAGRTRENCDYFSTTALVNLVRKSGSPVEESSENVELLITPASAFTEIVFLAKLPAFIVRLPVVRLDNCRESNRSIFASSRRGIRIDALRLCFIGLLTDGNPSLLPGLLPNRLAITSRSVMRNRNQYLHW